MEKLTRGLLERVAQKRCWTKRFADRLDKTMCGIVWMHVGYRANSG
jgi:hypothetical protein